MPRCENGFIMTAVFWGKKTDEGLSLFWNPFSGVLGLGPLPRMDWAPVTTDKKHENGLNLRD